MRITLEKGTQSGKILRLKGKGLPDFQRSGKGDMLVYVSLWTPQHISEVQKQFFQSVENDPNFEPNPSASQKRTFKDRLKEMFR